MKNIRNSNRQAGMIERSEIASDLFPKEIGNEAFRIAYKSSVDLEWGGLPIGNGMYVAIVEGHDLRSREAKQYRGVRRHYELSVWKILQCRVE